MATILVEDDAATAEFLNLVLKGAGYHVLQIAHGQAALRVLQAIRVQLVLTDPGCPSSMAAACAKRWPPIRAIRRFHGC
jgi:DNA-binding response OmpR family regulator